MAKPHVRPKMMGSAFHASSAQARDVIAWNPSRGSADSDLLPELGPIVYRQRDLVRNNGVAHGAVQTIVDNVVGTGLRLSARPDYAALGKSKEWAVEWAAKTESYYHAWWWSTACDARDMHSGDQLCAQAMFAKINNGASLTLPLWLPGRGDGYATKLQMIEIDRLSNPNGAAETTRMHGGIEFDEFGAPLAYNIRRRHPGETFTDFADPMVATWDRIPRRTSFGRLRVIHDFDAERSAQTRGIPLMAAILPQFKNLDRYTQSELQAALMNAMIFGTITTPMSGDDIVDLFSKDPQAYLKARAENAVRMQSGSLLALHPGDKLEGFIPQRPATGFAAFVENIYRIIGVGLDIPYELVLKDFSKTNYSSARSAMLEAWRSFNRRRDWLGTMWLDPIYGLFLEELVNDGRIEAPDFYVMRRAYMRCRWIGPGKGWVDPVKEAQAAGIRVTNYLSTLEDECAEQGKDWIEILEQAARERDKLDELKLPPLQKAAAYPLNTASNAPPGTGDGQQPGDGQPGDGQPGDGQGGQGAQADTLLLRAVALALAREPAAPAVTFAEGAIRVDNNMASPPEPRAASSAERPLVESEVLEVDGEGRALRVRESETYETEAAREARKPRPEPGTVLRRVEKEVVARDAEGRILRSVELEIAV